VQDNSKSYGRIFLKFWGYVGHGISYKWLNLWGDPVGILYSGSLWNFRYHWVKEGIREPLQNWRWWRHLANSIALAKLWLLSRYTYNNDWGLIILWESLLYITPVGGPTCYSASYISHTCDQKRFAISEVAADRHKPMISPRTMRPSIAGGVGLHPVTRNPATRQNPVLSQECNALRWTIGIDGDSFIPVSSVQFQTPDPVYNGSTAARIYSVSPAFCR